VIASGRELSWRGMVRLTAAVACSCVALAHVTASLAAGEEPAKVDFVQHIQPIFVEHCYQCHGPDKQESGLRLDQRAAALKGGDAGPWFIAGSSQSSDIVRRATAANPEERMPPPGVQTKPLSAAQIATIARWIDQGGKWPEAKVAGSNHWAFQPIERPAPPAVKDESWPRGAIDRFVLARLEAQGIRPSAEADRYTLIKRLAYDLVGLPPEPAEVDAFVADRSPDAYEKLVNRLLDSPRFGERWGRRWLDMARYADSDGYEKDNPRPDAWRYRDWVIDAVNADMPLDRFTIEQLAGDLLPGATAQERLATAFHRQTLTNTEGGADPEQFRVEAIFDRVATTGSVWLGLTIGCAQCHSHKYDPITHQEYYQLFAFFNNGDETETEVPLVGETLDKWNRETDDARNKLNKSEPKLVKARADIAAGLPEWESQLKSAAATPLEFHPIELVSAKSAAGSEMKILSDGSYLVSGTNPQVDKYTIVAKTDLAKDITGFRVEALTHDSLGGRGPGRTGHGNFVLTEFRAFAAASAEIHSDNRVEIAQAVADSSQPEHPAANAIDGKEPTGWSIVPETGRDHWILFTTKQPLKPHERPWLQLVLSQNYGSQHTLGRFRLMAVTGYDPLLSVPQAVRDVLAVPSDMRTAEQTAALVEYRAGEDKKVAELIADVNKLRQRVAAQPVMKARVLAERTARRRASHLLSRGDFLQPDGEVQPGTLAVLPPLKPRAVGSADRLDLATWLVDPANPLVRRVMVNQLWSSLFGRGIVRTANDFGVRGERPTHPELLDWLASEMTARGWSRKEMIRLVVASATYRQASGHRTELVDVDPLNDLFHRQNRYRVEAEIVRDLSLATAGLLSDKVGGPSVFPPLPPDIAELSYANNFKWSNSTGEDRYRRGMYTFFKRTAPHPNLTTFDCPDSNTTCVERRTSNTPLQALATLNNEIFSEAAQAMARRVLSATASDDEERLKMALRWCVTRPATAEELTAFGELLTQSRQWYASHSAEATAALGAFKSAGASTEESAAWVATVRIMMNLDEFLTRE
jgi:mono/diheme cytochrome c family protein